MASSTSISAVGAYRQLLRATRIAFHGDFRILHAARLEARKQFDENRRLGVSTPMQIQHAIDTANILRHNIVQGEKVEGTDGDRYELRIHEDIERGDNDTIKVGNKTVKAEKCCSS